MALPTKVYEPGDEVVVEWTVKPAFRFDTEVQALLTLRDLSEHMSGLRKELEHTMRYMKAAVQAAREVDEGDGMPVSMQAIIGESGLSRRTVYKMLSGQEVLAS